MARLSVFGWSVPGVPQLLVCHPRLCWLGVTLWPAKKEGLTKEARSHLRALHVGSVVCATVRWGQLWSMYVCSLVSFRVTPFLVTRGLRRRIIARLRSGRDCHLAFCVQTTADSEMNSGWREVTPCSRSRAMLGNAGPFHAHQHPRHRHAAAVMPTLCPSPVSLILPPPQSPLCPSLALENLNSRP